MDFKSRFKGRVSTMNKEGVLGIVKQQGQPVDKNYVQQEIVQNSRPIQQEIYSKKNMNYFYKQEEQVLQSKVYTNIDANRNHIRPVKPNEQFKQNAQMMLQNHQSQEPSIPEVYRSQQFNQPNYGLQYKNDFNGLNMNDYEIVAVPKKLLSNNMFYQPSSSPYQEYPVSQSGMSTSHVFRQDNNEPSHISPLIKTYSYDPKFLQKNIDDGYSQKSSIPRRSSMVQRGKMNLMQAGVGTLTKGVTRTQRQKLH